MSRSFVVIVWLVLSGSSFLGFAVVGTGALIAGDPGAIQIGLLLWVIGTICAFVGTFFALRRASWAAIGCALPAPFFLALITGHFVLGVKAW